VLFFLIITSSRDLLGKEPFNKLKALVSLGISSISYLTNNCKAGNIKTHIATRKKNFISALIIPLKLREIYKKDIKNTGFEFIK
jgi:hypothetical protein